MNIAVVTPYGDAYSRDRLFDQNACKIGQNLLLPGILLKKRLEEMGHNYHTVDMYSNIKEIDIWIFQDLNNTSRLTSTSMQDAAKYLIKRKWKQDYLYKYSKLKNGSRSILLMQEPATVFPQSYDRNNQKIFDKILTWDSNLVDNIKYFQFFYPQVKPEHINYIPYDKKKFITMICGNKSSSDKNELYSERYRAINYFEKMHEDFDLYGFGWNEDLVKSYRGKTNDKLETMSKYKFSICFENMKSSFGYITEKIFDCFFSGCVPIYYGADDIANYIPENSFIDYRKFTNFKALDEYLINMSKNEYELYLENAIRYLEGISFEDTFSVNAYVSRMVEAITKWKE